MKLSREQRKVIKEIIRINYNQWAKMSVILESRSWPVELISVRPKWWSDNDHLSSNPDEFRTKQKKFISPILFYLKRRITPSEYYYAFYVFIIGCSGEEAMERWKTEKYSKCAFYYREMEVASITNTILLKDFQPTLMTIFDY